MRAKENDSAALSEYERVILLADELYIADGRRLAPVLVKAAYGFEQIEHWEQAESLYRRALRMLDVNVRGDDPATADCLEGLAELYESSHRFGECREAN
ncbi:MAG TPA: hypothetical protein VHX65_13355 [Pirellulales bacterium]|nr:hypothetical protein [Pirellulales bacterium]